MAGIGDTLEEEQAKRRTAFIPWRWLAIASFLIIAIPVGILIANRLRGSPTERGTRALVEAFRKQRLIEPRLSGGFPCGEFKPSPGDRSHVDTQELDRASELIMDALAKGDSSAQLPYARLLLSKDEKLPEALQYLRRAVAGAPERAEAHNDLGVCFIQQGKLEDAIDEFEVALKHKTDMPEALFNRALCYGRLLLRDAADADLARLVDIEHDKDWLAEARRRRNELSAPNSARPAVEIMKDLNEALADDLSWAREIVDRNYEAVRRYYYFELVQQYLQPADAVGQETVDLVRSRMENISQLAVDVKGDHDIADTVKRLITIPEQEHAHELGLFRDYKKASDLISDGKYDEARMALERLHEVFQKQGDSLFQAKTKYSIAQSLYQSRRFTASLTLLGEILPLFEARGWRYHQAQTLDLIGLDYSRLGQDSKAFKYFRQASELFEKMREPVAYPLQYVGMTCWHLGNFDKALENLHTSTDLFLKQGSPPVQLANNYLNVADVYRLLDRSQLALLFAEEALKYSNKAKDMNRAAQASSFEAVEFAHAGEMDLAAAKIKQAFQDLEGIGAASRAYTEPLVLARAGEVAAQRGDTASALQHYTKAELLTSNAEGDKILNINALRGRAAAYAKAGQSELARKDLEKAIAIIEGYRRNLIGRVHRMEFLGASQGVFDQMIVLDAAQPERAPEAFEMSERSRARGLLDDFEPAASDDGRTAKPISLDRVRAALPDNLTLLVYSVTDERTHVFLVTRSAFRIAPSPVTTRQLERLVNDYVSQVRNPDAPIEELSEKARALYRLLIEPVKEWLTEGTELCIVPDKSLQMLPMATLKDSSDRYLIESFRLVCAPSASVFIRCFNQARAEVGRNEERLLAVGDPEFSSEDFPKLRSLDDARREAEETSAYYDRPVVLTEANASEPAVRAAMKNCNVAHLAVHCIVDQQSPWLSSLLLGPETGSFKSRADKKIEPNDPASSASDNSLGRLQLGLMLETPADNPTDGLLYLNEIYNLKLPGTRMVVLSACETALGQYYRGEGIVSLIHPFLAARVSTVVASLWPVESRATSVLMIGFHKERRTAGKRAGDALRAAQLKMIAEFPHPYYWASFIVVGGDY